MEPVVSTEWVAGHLDDPDLRVLDATVDIDRSTGRVESGRARWETAHIPGAGFADLLVELSDPQGPLPFTMPSPDRFAAAMSGLGVGDTNRVVLYDARESMWAARLWWMLRVFGFDEAAILDGGWTSWVAEGRPVTADPPVRPHATFTPRLRSDLVADKDRVRRVLGERKTCIVDALTPREYRGEVPLYGRPGHIPGAVNVPARHIVDRYTQHFLPRETLRDMFTAPLAAERVVTYCGGGVAAASDAFALHLLGYDRVAVYDGSMLEWCADPELPLVTGDEPG